MKYSDIENKSLNELIKQKKDLTSVLFEIKMKHNLGQLANPIEIKVVRKDIARINTAIVKLSVR